MANKNLTNAKKAKNDEFYTQMSDIEKELQYYKAHFAGKTVFCNCDDPTWSNFWRYFHLKFSDLKLKKLIATHYDATQPTYKIEYEGGNDNDYEVGTITPLSQNGDFRSSECVGLLKEADIVVTNPPFSLFREYVAQLMEYGKRFIIIGNMNCITYKEIFPLIKDNKLWAGANEKGGSRKGNSLSFGVSPEYSGRTVIENGKRVAQISAWWFTNLDIAKRHEPLDLVYKYDSERYPRYDNYDAINVDKTVEIPYDYVPCWFECPYSVNCHYAQSEGKEDGAFCEIHCNGEMGVPISYLDKHCPEQFEIVGNGGSCVGEGSVAAELYVGGETEPNRTEPNRTEPNRTEPNRTEPNRTEQPGGRSSSELLFAGYRKCNGIIGVPISFLDKYCPEQFRIVEGSNRYAILDWWGRNGDIKRKHSHGNNIDGKATYFRIHIQQVQRCDGCTDKFP